MHEVLVNRLGGLRLPRKSLARLTDRPDMTLDVYRRRKTTHKTIEDVDLSKSLPTTHDDSGYEIVFSKDYRGPRKPAWMKDFIFAAADRSKTDISEAKITSTRPIPAKWEPVPTPGALKDRCDEIAKEVIIVEGEETMGRCLK